MCNRSGGREPGAILDLHRHLEGSLRPETLWAFHEAQGQRRHGSLDALRRALVVPSGEHPGFLGFLSRFDALRFRYGGLNEIERVGREVVEDAALDGVVYLELRFSPVFLARRLREQPEGDPFTAPPPPGEDLEAVAEAVVRGARAEASRRGIGIAFILCLNRAGGLMLNRSAADLLRRPVGEAFAALDVAGDESVSLDEATPLLAEWREAGKALTLHAGEDPRGDGAARVREAVLVHGATRVGHGIRAIEDVETLALLRDQGTVLETCLTSNVQTGAAASYETHPLKRLLSAGVRATLNSDDPTVSGMRLSDDYERAVNAAGLSQAELQQAILNAVDGAFTTEAQRVELRRSCRASHRLHYSVRHEGAQDQRKSDPSDGIT